MNKFFYYSDLYNIYKELLTEKESNICSLYYEENLSMSEIAENLTISRSAVFNLLKAAETKLTKYETTLKIKEKTDQLKEIISQINDPIIQKKLETIIN